MKFVFGSYSYEYELVRQKRKTISLTVEPSLKIILKVPEEASSEKIDRFLRKKWIWLEKQLWEFKKYRKKKYDKEYASGESFYFLGKQYKLLVKKSFGDKVTITKREIVVDSVLGTDSSRYVKILLDRWYKRQRNEIFRERLLLRMRLFDGAVIPRLLIRDMTKRWGSYVSDSKIILNPKLIYTPIECIDYVITHELCHLKNKNHDISFYKLLEKKYPKWEKVKERLELMDF